MQFFSETNYWKMHILAYFVLVWCMATARSEAEQRVKVTEGAAFIKRGLVHPAIKAFSVLVTIDIGVPNELFNALTDTNALVSNQYPNHSDIKRFVERTGDHIKKLDAIMKKNQKKFNFTGNEEDIINFENQTKLSCEESIISPAWAEVVDKLYSAKRDIDNNVKSNPETKFIEDKLFGIEVNLGKLLELRQNLEVNISKVHVPKRILDVFFSEQHAENLLGIIIDKFPNNLKLVKKYTKSVKDLLHVKNFQLIQGNYEIKLEVDVFSQDLIFEVFEIIPIWQSIGNSFFSQHIVHNNFYFINSTLNAFFAFNDWSRLDCQYYGDLRFCNTFSTATVHSDAVKDCGTALWFNRNVSLHCKLRVGLTPENIFIPIHGDLFYAVPQPQEVHFNCPDGRKIPSIIVEGVDLISMKACNVLVNSTLYFSGRSTSLETKTKIEFFSETNAPITLLPALQEDPKDILNKSISKDNAKEVLILLMESPSVDEESVDDFVEVIKDYLPFSVTEWFKVKQANINTLLHVILGVFAFLVYMFQCGYTEMIWDMLSAIYGKLRGKRRTPRDRIVSDPAENSKIFKKGEGRHVV